LFLFFGISISWIIISFFSKGDLFDISSLLLLQILLTFILSFFIFRYYPKKSSLIQIVSLHTLIYYGLFNVVPALVIDWRPENISIMLSRIPKSDIIFYSLSTLASVLFFFGCVFGIIVYNYFFNRKILSKSYSMNWFLPSSKLCLNIGIFLIIIQIISLFLFALNTNLITDDDILKLNFFEQVVFHGITYFSNISILLFVSAYTQCIDLEKRKHIKIVTIFSVLISLAVVIVLGQRSTVLISFMLPILYLLTNGKIKMTKVFLPFLLFSFILYSVVSFFRDANVKAILSIAKSNEIDLIEASKDVSSTKDDFNLVTRGIGDISYRTAGLEPCAAIIQSQFKGELNYQWGNTIYSGILQALPRFFRNSDYIPERIKTAPYNFRVFDEGDWVTTILSEFVLDFGPFLLVFPAIVLGIILAFIDHVFLSLIRYNFFESFSIIRISFLIFILSNGGSFSEITFLFFKAVSGFAFIFIIISLVSNVSFKSQKYFHDLSNL
jgi:hypothetical protein